MWVVIRVFYFKAWVVIKWKIPLTTSSCYAQPVCFFFLWDKFLCRRVLVFDADAVYLTQNCFFVFFVLLLETALNGN
uniref:Putative secreted protein n=1 Tax=Ixodes ricinus TaxID=34613 RepID=A0A6B0U4G8_IXORI